MDFFIDKFAVTYQYWSRAKLLTQIDAFPAEVWEDPCEKKGISEIHKIVMGISYDDLDTKVRAFPETLDQVDSYGYRPLDYAIRFGKSNHVKVLLSHGADIGRRPHDIFWTAVESSDCASIQILLDRGLRPNDLVPYAIEDHYRASQWGVGQFHQYIEDYGYCKPAIGRLLIDYGFDFNNGGYDGVTALMACCRRHSWPKGTKRMEFLLEHGVDPEVTDNYGRTAIHHALYNDNLPAFKMLIRYGARLDAWTSKDETVLHIAVKWTREVAMIRALSKAGIMQLDLDAPQHDGRIAFNFLRHRAAKLAETHQKFLFEDHIRIIRAFESLFQEIQEHQGVPLEDRYPALHIAALRTDSAAVPVKAIYPASSSHTIYEASDGDDITAKSESKEPICAPPGAWPE